jgi:hypothetical protein
MRTRLGFVVTTLALLIAVPAFSDDPPKQAVSFATGITEDNSIAYRHLFGPYAGLVSLGYLHSSQHQTNSDGVNDHSTFSSWNAGVGLRRYFNRQAQVTPFLEADAKRAFPSNFSSGCETYNYSGTLGGGAEYHITRALSLEGMAGVAFSRGGGRCTGEGLQSNDDFRQVSTFRSAIALSFYF